MIWLRRFIFALPVALLLFFGLAFVSVRVTPPKKLNQLVSATAGEAKTLNPILSTTTADSEVTSLVFNGLIDLDENLQMVGDLAENWTLRQTTYLYFRTGAAAASALSRIAAHKADWKRIGLGKIKLDGRAVRLDITKPGAAYRERLFKWFDAETLCPVAFLRIALQKDRNFADGTKVSGEAAIKRIEKALKTRPALDEQVIYYWRDTSLSFQMLVAGDPKPVVERVNAVLPPPTLTAQEKKEKTAPDPPCRLAESFPARDEPEITFHLRKGVRWHDGKPFTSADVRFTYEALVDEKVASPRRSDYELVREAQAPDPYTFRVIYKKPYSPALLSWAMGILPSHLLRGKDTKWWAKHFDRSPTGTGPFIFDEWRSNEYIRLRRNPDYFEGPPHLDYVVIRALPDPLTRRLSFETGEIDSWGVAPHALGRVRNDERFKIYSRLSNGYIYVGWNLRRPIFQDRRTRRALCHAVNVPQIVKYVLYGQGEQSRGTFSPVMWYANEDVEPFRHDPEKARELLAEAGWEPRPEDGILVKDGEPFEFILITNQGSDLRKDVATLVQSDLKAIGVKVNIETYEWAVFVHKKIDKLDFDACILGWSLGADYDQYQLWHSSQAKPKRLNFCSYKNEKVDRLIELARSEYEPRQIKHYCGEIQRIIYEDQPYLFLFVPRGATALHKDVYRVMRPGPNGTWIDEPIRDTKAGIGVYRRWWYRVDNPPKPRGAVIRKDGDSPEVPG